MTAAADILQRHADTIARAKALTDVLALAPQERRELLRQLQAAGVPMAPLAAALGISRQRLYEIVGPADGVAKGSQAPETHALP